MSTPQKERENEIDLKIVSLLITQKARNQKMSMDGYNHSMNACRFMDVAISNYTSIQHYLSTMEDLDALMLVNAHCLVMAEAFSHVFASAQLLEREKLRGYGDVMLEMRKQWFTLRKSCEKDSFLPFIKSLTAEVSQAEAVMYRDAMERAMCVETIPDFADLCIPTSSWDSFVNFKQRKDYPATLESAMIHEIQCYDYADAVTYSLNRMIRNCEKVHIPGVFAKFDRYLRKLKGAHALSSRFMCWAYSTRHSTAQSSSIEDREYD